MNTADLAAIFNADAASAVSPMIAITAGILLLLVADMFDNLAKLRPAVVLGSLTVALIASLTLHVPAYMGLVEILIPNFVIIGRRLGPGLEGRQCFPGVHRGASPRPVRLGLQGVIHGLAVFIGAFLTWRK